MLPLPPAFLPVLEPDPSRCGALTNHDNLFTAIFQQRVRFVGLAAFRRGRPLVYVGGLRRFLPLISHQFFRFQPCFLRRFFLSWESRLPRPLCIVIGSSVVQGKVLVTEDQDHHRQPSKGGS